MLKNTKLQRYHITHTNEKGVLCDGKRFIVEYFFETKRYFPFSVYCVSLLRPVTPCFAFWRRKKKAKSF